MKCELLYNRQKYNWYKKNYIKHPIPEGISFTNVENYLTDRNFFYHVEQELKLSKSFLNISYYHKLLYKTYDYIYTFNKINSYSNYHKIFKRNKILNIIKSTLDKRIVKYFINQKNKKNLLEMIILRIIKRFYCNNELISETELCNDFFVFELYYNNYFYKLLDEKYTINFDETMLKTLRLYYETAECPICYETIKTYECVNKHSLACVNCICKINKCPMCYWTPDIPEQIFFYDHPLFDFLEYTYLCDEILFNEDSDCSEESFLENTE